jgi:hypothetical protein
VHVRGEIKGWVAERVWCSVCYRENIIIIIIHLLSSSSLTLSALDGDFSNDSIGKIHAFHVSTSSFSQAIIIIMYVCKSILFLFFFSPPFFFSSQE